MVDLVYTLISIYLDILVYRSVATPTCILGNVQSSRMFISVLAELTSNVHEIEHATLIFTNSLIMIEC